MADTDTLDPVGATGWADAIAPKTAKKGSKAPAKESSISLDPAHDEDKSEQDQGSPAWQKLVAKVGQNAARVAAPQLDPDYQKLVAKEGQAKGSVDYSHQFIDPITQSPNKADIPGGLEQFGKNIIGPVGAGLISNLASSSPTAAPKGKTKKPPETAAQKTAAAAAAQTAATTKEQQEIANSPATKLMNGLISDYQTAMAANQPYMSGAAGQQAVAKADAMSGDKVGDPAAQAMLTSDAGAVGAAQSAGAAGVTTALQNMGTANAEALQVSPYQSLLQGLQSEAQYKIETGTGATAPANAPAWYKAALSMTGDSSTPSGTALPGLPTSPKTSSTSPSTDSGDGASGS